jgi:hypothetical protein
MPSKWAQFGRGSSLRNVGYLGERFQSLGFPRSVWSCRYVLVVKRYQSQ